jgi:sugar phosphate isomerase/epimerase
MPHAESSRVGLEFITALGLNPVRFVEAAGQLGCRHIGLALEPIVTCSGIESGWSLRQNATLRRDLAAALQDHGVSISIAEGFIAMPGTGLASSTDADLALFAHLGATCANLVSVEPDEGRAFDQCARFAEMAAAHGMSATIEFLPGLPIMCDLPSAIRAIDHVGLPGFGVLIDAMHLFRSGGTVADVAQLDPATIGYVQLCDVPSKSLFAQYADEARFERLAPGEGDLPLEALIDVLPRTLILGLEVPMRGAAEAGVELVERVGPAIAATERLAAAAERA